MTEANFLQHSVKAVIKGFAFFQSKCSLIATVCHGFRLMKRDDYFRVAFDYLLSSASFFKQPCSSKNLLMSKTKRP